MKKLKNGLKIIYDEIKNNKEVIASFATIGIAYTILEQNNLFPATDPYLVDKMLHALFGSATSRVTDRAYTLYKKFRKQPVDPIKQMHYSMLVGNLAGIAQELSEEFGVFNPRHPADFWDYAATGLGAVARQIVDKAPTLEEKLMGFGNKVKRSLTGLVDKVQS
ncbi:MAG: hypothetical protein OH319_02810 [Candidatus Parvarchaeota archaeon]|nr:hypothetical protein [Candidatus Jingweiarchaeum tengchongense]MCW1298299.1 hypothetical protein [Candidatus Jingweiarchaeum tengchongense]MCW1300390.1 hypothetical protein [Candidatus Jingweiarchaeum tengchongense]MCW1304765.1 hypothetical protein [Candidatus Jingweiarchaeum tengchongense]MCW1305355.1 hypothetical protein [Candidatus Jingweiarchaeum tengchongense]